MSHFSFLAKLRRGEGPAPVSVGLWEGLDLRTAAQKTRCHSGGLINQTGAEGKAFLKTHTPIRDGQTLSVSTSLWWEEAGPAPGLREALGRVPDRWETI